MIPHHHHQTKHQHADTKEYFGGCQHEIKEQQGHISCNFDLHAAPLDAPIKFKAWISPRGAASIVFVLYGLTMDGWIYRPIDRPVIHQHQPPGLLKKD